MNGPLDIMDYLSIFTSVATVLAIIFGVFFFFRNPQIKLDRSLALADKELDSKATVLAQKELENKANVLAEQVKNKDVENERRFSELNKNTTDALAMAQNHIHTVDTKVDGLANTITQMNLSLTNELTKLGTIISERMPKS